MHPRAATRSAEDEFEGALYAELVERLFSNALSIGSMGALFAAFGLLVAHRMGDALLAGLSVAGGLAAAAHVAVVRLYRAGSRARTRQALRTWEMRYAAAGLASAACVGFAAARTFLGDDLGSAMMMTGLIFGYASGVMARAATRPWITAPRMAVLVAAPVSVLLSRGDALFAAQALLLLLFLLAGLETMLSLHRQAVAEIGTSLRRNETARRDPLTGLANRRALAEGLAERLARNDDVAVHCLDLDRFKAVNDTYGHPVGDRLLQAVAERLAGFARPDDIVARIGGDEFVVVQARAGGARRAERLAATLVEALGKPYRFGALELTSAASIGVALAIQGSSDAPTLMAEADAALYASKARGRGRYTLRRPDPPAP